MNILDTFLSAYNFSHKNTSYISNDKFYDILEKNGLKNKLPPDLAIMNINNGIIKCTNKKDVRITKRAELYETYFQKIINEYNIKFKNNSCFIIDLSDGCANRDFLFNFDKICLATCVPNRNSICSLPTIEPHYLYEPMRKYYDGSIVFNNKSWKEKENKLAYRGTARPTTRPDVREGSGTTWITPRLDFMSKYFDHPRVDIGFSRIPNDKSFDIYKQYTAPRIDDMSDFKYLIIILGIGANNEATTWMLQTNSIIFRMCSTNKNTLIKDAPDWLLWWDTVFIPYKHYIPFNIDNLEEMINYCDKNHNLMEKILINQKELFETIMPEYDKYSYNLLSLISGI